MARKSRKPNNKVDVPDQKPSLIQIAAYVRLSLENRGQKGTPIENQQLIISSYMEEHPDFELYDTYIDSGVSGTNFERPSFQRMLRDAEVGNISCIIVKDLSRLGRNAIDTGYFVEKLFPSLGIRLISITDNYDSTIDTGSIALPLTNLVNEVYAIDISRKTRAQKRQAMKDGMFVGGRPPYGYKRLSDDRHKLVVDTPAAETVRQIFIWAADDISIYEIVKRLNSSSIPSPMAYISGMSGSKKTHPEVSELWHSRTVKRILENEIYLGRLIQGKTRKINFMRQPTPEDEWIHFNESHAAIVSVELFQAVQTLRNKSQDSSQNGPRAVYSANIFKGKIYCAHCGGYLERKKNHDRYIYHCVANRTAPNSCVGNRIGENDVRFAILEQLHQYKDQICSDSNVLSDPTDIIRELRFLEMEISHMQDIIRSLYENLVNGVLNATEYGESKSSYQEKFDILKPRADELKQMLKNEKREKAALQESMCILDKLVETMVLTKEHVNRFVERIEVFRDGRIYVEFLDIHKV